MAATRRVNQRFRTTGKRVKSHKTPAAVTLGKLGGKKGGPARSRALSSGKKTEIARHAAKKRWGKTTSYAKPNFYRRKVR